MPFILTSQAATVTDYLAELPEERRAVIEAVRDVIRKNIDPKAEEIMQYGMIGYAIPHSLYPYGYHCDPKQPLPYVHLAAQKNFYAIYIFCLYANSDLSAWFANAYAQAGKKLDMGKGCVRFKKLDDLPLDVIAETLRRIPVDAFIQNYEAALPDKVKEKRKPK
jgi:uncharacterized protein YdhG (YjbR/CyaY superfamily)